VQIDVIGNTAIAFHPHNSHGANRAAP
jgi:hypothetical protein